MKRSMLRHVIIITFGLLCVAAAAATVRAYLANKQTETAVNAFRLDGLEQRTSDTPMRLAKGVVPPTNKWFSSLVFGQAQTVFAYPFSYRATETGFELGVPTVSSQPHVVTAPHAADITVQTGASSYIVSGYDDLSATVRYTNQQQPSGLGEVRLTQGSPFVFLRTTQAHDITVRLRGTPDSRSRDGSLLFTLDNQRYGIAAERIEETAAGVFTIRAAAGKDIAIFAMPNGADETTYTSAAKNPLRSTHVSLRRLDDKIRTTYRVETTNKQPTIIGMLPHHTSGTKGDPTGTFDTLYGQLVMHKGNEFTYELDTDQPPLQLDIANLSESQKDALRTQLLRDTANLKLEKPDTYFGGKELYRAANLLLLARQLGDSDSEKTIAAALKSALKDWLSKPSGRVTRFFYYDTHLKGIVGVQPSFGSELFNDHHFHYGYFIYAASVLAEIDREFLDTYKPMIDVLVADIASPGSSSALPKLRHYDAFTGHSWASGFSDFDDGNNQESSSEAVNAWYAIYRWGRVNKDSSLSDMALWLYSNEAASARTYWLNDQRETKGFEQYSHPLVSLVWNGKRDYATFFSPRPEAQLGIQLIPMSPGQEYLRHTDINKQLATIPADQPVEQFADYLAMYRAYEDPSAALVAANALSNTQIDDGNSRTYMLAWIYHLQNQ